MRFLVKLFIFLPSVVQDIFVELALSTGAGYIFVLLAKLYKIHTAIPFILIFVLFAMFFSLKNICNNAPTDNTSIAPTSALHDVFKVSEYISNKANIDILVSIETSHETKVENANFNLKSKIDVVLDIGINKVAENINISANSMLHYFLSAEDEENERSDYFDFDDYLNESMDDSESSHDINIADDSISKDKMIVHTDSLTSRQSSISDSSSESSEDSEVSILELFSSFDSNEE